MARISILSVALMFSMVGCAYQLGYRQRALPGGYDRVAIPVFKNKTQEPGIETYFTSAIVGEFERSSAAHVVPKSSASVILEGVVENLELKRSANIGSDIAPRLPKDTVLTTEYRILLTTRLVLRRRADLQIIWQSVFQDEKIYQAPQVTQPIANTVNPLYNHSARHQNISAIAKDMMADAYSRMTEKF